MSSPSYENDESLEYDYPTWEEQMAKSRFKSSKTAKNGVKHLQQSPTNLRACILYESLLGKPIFETFKNFCDVMGDDAMEYHEFEFWYMRFANGKHDLNYDRSQDPKTRTLSDMPVNVFGEIMKKTTWKEQIVLRQVCQSLEHCVDESVFTFENATLDVQDLYASLDLDGVHRSYADPGDDWDYDFQNMSESDFGVALRDIKLILKHPKIKIENFSVNFGIREIERTSGLWSKIEEYLRLVNPYVKSISLCGWCDMSYFLECLKPGILEKIVMGSCIYDGRILEFDQWKQAKIVEIDVNTEYVLMENFTHFAQFEVRNISYFKKEDLLILKNALLNSPNFERCYFWWTDFKKWTETDMDDVERDLEVQNDSLDPSYRHYVINENDGKRLEIKIEDGNKLEIERKH